VLGTLDFDVVRSIVELPGPADDRKALMLAAGGVNFDQVPIGLRLPMTVAILNCSTARLRIGQVVRPAVFSRFAMAVDPSAWVRSVLGHAGVPFGFLGGEKTLLAGMGKGSLARAFREFANLVSSFEHSSLVNAIEPWVSLTGFLVERFGKSWTAMELAVISGAIRNPGERGRGATSLVDDTKALPHRVRYARRQRESLEWWQDQLKDANDEFDLGLWMISLYAWADADVFNSMFGSLGLAFVSLSSESRSRFLQAAGRSEGYRASRGRLSAFHSDLIEQLPLELLALVYGRLDEDSRRLCMGERIEPGIDNERAATVFLTEKAAKLASGEISIDPDLLVLLARAHEAGGRCLYPGTIRPGRIAGLSDEVLTGLWAMPSFIVNLAPHALDKRSRRVKPVSQIAESERWFSA
jgi:hypothetical protein